jgi:hypothetical protein
MTSTTHLAWSFKGREADTAWLARNRQGDTVEWHVEDDYFWGAYTDAGHRFMQQLSTFLENLDRNYNPDFWAEVALPAIAKQLDQLEAQGWEGLMQAWIKLRPQGQINLVEACGASQHPMRMRLLEAMVYAPDAQVGAAVANQMLEQDYAWNPEISIRAEFKRHSANLEGYALRLVERMMLRLPR